MHLISINVGVLRTVTRDGAPRSTGIFKLPATGPVALTRAGLAGDVIVATMHHGGPDQAIYVYGAPDYDWWARQLGRDLPPGTFGENLTVAGFESGAARIGDRFVLGEVALEITAPRIPCGTFGARMEDERFPQRFRAAERPGVYCRVLREGTVRAGEPVRYEAAPDGALTVLEMFRDFYEPDRTAGAIQRFLAAPVAQRVRAHKENQLRALRPGGPSA